jgi:VanZ family protein
MIAQFLKTLIGVAQADSRFDRIVLAAKEAVVVIMVAQTVLAKAQEFLQTFLTAVPAK